MPKSSTVYVCQQCDYRSPKWAGQCPNCGQWNSLVETLVQPSPSKFSRSGSTKSHPRLQLSKLSELKPSQITRQTTGLSELDRVLGGGLVPGQAVLVAGEPGIGKSTLLTQLALQLSSSLPHSKGKPSLSSKNQPASVLYISGEESVNQVSLRVHRLLSSVSRHSKGPSPSPSSKIQGHEESLSNSSSRHPKLASPRLGRDSGSVQIPDQARNDVKPDNGTLDLDSFLLASQTDVDAITAEIQAQKRLSLIIIDSIQTMHTADLSGMAGSVGQVRECANRLIAVAKHHHLPLLLVGHVTKEGAIAGPRVLEHMVDTVLWFEGDRYGQLRLLRAIKNRFGPTDEVGVFQMTDAGFSQVQNPSQFFLDQYSSSSKDQPSGSAVAVIMEGLRPLLVEVQALVVPSQLAIPRRIGKGIDASRLNVIVAVLIKRLGLHLGKQDVYVNIAGGLKLKEPAADLAIAASIFSAYKNQPVKPSIAFTGEVGLLGEVRPVPQLPKRQKEAQRLGFKQLLSSGSLRQILHQALATG